MTRRELLHLLATAAAGGFALDPRLAEAQGERLYDVPRFGNVHLLHFTDCHAQLMPIHFREPNVNIGVAEAAGRPPHLGRARADRAPSGSSGFDLGPGTCAGRGHHGSGFFESCGCIGRPGHAGTWRLAGIPAGRIVSFSKTVAHPA